MVKEKVLNFDMDGTIANLYGYKNWLYCVENGIVEPFERCEPLYDMEILKEILFKLKEKGWRITVKTWLPKNATDEYEIDVAYTKRRWLKKYDFPVDDYYPLKYGTPKVGKGVLFDDDDRVRESWNGAEAIDAKDNIIPCLTTLLFE